MKSYQTEKTLLSLQMKLIEHNMVLKQKLLMPKMDKGMLLVKKIVYGFAKYMRDALPNATYLGFTGTPIESTDVNTPAVFGNYVDIYDIAQAVEDGATVVFIMKADWLK